MGADQDRTTRAKGYERKRGRTPSDAYPQTEVGFRGRALAWRNQSGPGSVSVDMRRFFVPGLTLVSLLAIAACTATSSPSPPVHTGRASRTPRPNHALPTGRLMVYSNSKDQIRFRYPASWTVGQFNQWTMESTTLVDLSTQPLHKPCTSTRSTTATSITCHWPLTHLGPDGVLMEWGAAGMPGWRLSRAPGIPITVGGHRARQAVSRPGWCGSIGATETISVEIARAATDNFYGITACLRGPDLARVASQVQVVIDSTSFSGT